MPDGMTHVPLGFQQVPYFRKKDTLYNRSWGLIRQPRKAAALKKSREVVGYQAWWNRKLEWLMQKSTAQADWHAAAEEARVVLAEMEKSGKFTSVEMLQVLGCVATLEDRGASVPDKRGAVRMIGDLFGLYSSRTQAESKQKVDDVEVAEGKIPPQPTLPVAGIPISELPTNQLLERLRSGEPDEL
jgi:hypothetical protein